MEQQNDKDILREIEACFRRELAEIVKERQAVVFPEKLETATQDLSELERWRWYE